MSSSPRPDTGSAPTRASHHVGRGEAPPGCNWGTPTGRCGQKGSPYPCGVRCPAHLPGHHLKSDDEKKADVTRDTPVTGPVTSQMATPKTPLSRVTSL